MVTMHSRMAFVVAVKLLWGDLAEAKFDPHWTELTLKAKEAGLLPSSLPSAPERHLATETAPMCPSGTSLVTGTWMAPPDPEDNVFASPKEFCVGGALSGPGSNSECIEVSGYDPVDGEAGLGALVDLTWTPAGNPFLPVRGIIGTSGRLTYFDLAADFGPVFLKRTQIDVFVQGPFSRRNLLCYVKEDGSNVLQAVNLARFPLRALVVEDISQPIDVPFVLTAYRVMVDFVRLCEIDPTSPFCGPVSAYAVGSISDDTPLFTNHLDFCAADADSE